MVRHDAPYPMMSTERDWPDGRVPVLVSRPRFRKDEEPTGAQLSIDAGPMGSVKACGASVREIRGPAPPSKACLLKNTPPGRRAQTPPRPTCAAAARDGCRQHPPPRTAKFS